MSLKGVVFKNQEVVIRASNSPAATGHCLVAYHFVMKGSEIVRNGVAVPIGKQDELLRALVPADAISMVIVIDMKDGDTGTASAEVSQEGAVVVATETIRTDPTVWSLAVLS